MASSVGFWRLVILFRLERRLDSGALMNTCRSETGNGRSSGMADSGPSGVAMGAMYENRTRTHPAGRRTDKDYSAKWGWGKRNSLMMEQLGVLARCGRNRLPIHKTLAGLIFHRLVHQKTDLIAHSVKKIARGLPQDEDQPYSRNALDAMAKNTGVQLGMGRKTFSNMGRRSPTGRGPREVYNSGTWSATMLTMGDRSPRVRTHAENCGVYRLKRGLNVCCYT